MKMIENENVVIEEEEKFYETNDNNIEDENDNDENQHTNKRQRNPPKWLEDYDTSYLCEVEENEKYWSKAIKEEIKAHIINGTWEIIEKRKNENIVDRKMILKNKYGQDGQIERKKARLVARVFTQRPGIDFTETYAPVTKLSTIRLVIANAVEEKMKLHQLDGLT